MDNSQYKELFLSESQEILAVLNKTLLYLEKNSNDTKCLDEMFRQCHTLKGMAATMEYNLIVRLAHAIENILDSVRKGAEVDTAIIHFLFKGIDLLTAALKEIQAGTNENGGTSAFILQTEHFVNEMSNLTSKHLNLAATDKLENTPNKDKENISSSIVSSSETLSTTSPSIRINLDRLESLMNAVGELVTNKIRIMELSKMLDDPNLVEAVSDLERVTDRLQSEAMQIRLIPLEYLLSYFPRMVRDMAKLEGKEVIFSVSGTDIGVDRTVLDEINDPLIHLLRNAVNHGIETPTERESLGKSREAHITIHAHREKQFVVLTINDDGRGLDIEKIKTALVAQNRMTADELAKLSDTEIFMLITLPGFSLSEKVTEGAGRGVGMNVVRTKVESIGGAFSIESERGLGCTIKLKLPLTMAIIHVMLVELAGQTLAIPLANITESIKVDASLIKHVEQEEIIPYRDSVLVLMRLQDKLEFKGERRAPLTGKLSILVCEILNKKMGLIVDNFIGEKEVIVKNLTGRLHKLHGFSGATILGSGRIAMILDFFSLVTETEDN